MTIRWVWISGWVMPAELYSGSNRIVVSVAEPHEVAAKLNLIFSQYPTDSIRVFGHSLGGFVLAKALSLLAFQPEKIAFVGIRRGYPQSELEGMAKLIHRHGLSALQGFYAAAAPDGSIWDHYGQLIQAQWPLDRILSSLSHLTHFQMPEIPCVFAHGEHDQIAPLSEAVSIATELNQPLHIIKKGSHLPPMNQIEALV